MGRAIQRRSWVAAVAALIACLAVTAAAEDRAAPSIEMRSFKGVRVRLSDYQGKIVLLKLWASWCPDCVASFTSLEALQRQYKAKGFEIIAVSVDGERKDAERFLKTRPYPLTGMFDPRGRVAEAFGAVGIPTAYLIDRRGRIRFSHEGLATSDDAVYRRQIDELLAEP
jgi:peroxiredoxin